MEYDCLTKDGKLVIAKPRGWKWSKREMSDFDIAIHSQSVVSLHDASVTLKNGVKCNLTEIDRALVADNLSLKEIATAKSLLELNGYAVDKKIITEAVK